MKVRDFQKAKKYADLTISLVPDLVDGYVMKWEHFYLQGRWRDARVVLDETPAGLPMGITHFNQEFAERRFEEALATLNAKEADIRRLEAQLEEAAAAAADRLK